MAASMAASMVSDARKETAFHNFAAEFEKNGFHVPEGLMNLLRRFSLKEEETSEMARHRLYKHLWAIMWFGSNKTLGSHVSGKQPTYVFPKTLKAVVREIIPGQLVDKDDPTHDRVYQVNIGDLANAKWPVIKDKKEEKKKEKSQKKKAKKVLNY